MILSACNHSGLCECEDACREESKTVLRVLSYIVCPTHVVCHGVVFKEHDPLSSVVV